MAVPTPATEDAELNRVALRLTETHGARISAAVDARVFIADLYDGRLRLEVRTDRSFIGAPSHVPNVYLLVYRRTGAGLELVARRSSGWGLLEGGDLRPALAETLLRVVARRPTR